MTYPKVSIIILNWNGYEDTIECLESLRKISYPNYEIIIVDNASSGDDVHILREKYGEYIHVIANDKNSGFPEGCNIGMRYALGDGTDYLLLLNNDVIVDCEFLSKLVEVAQSDQSIGIAGSKVYYYRKPNFIQSAGGNINWWLGYIKVYGEEEDIGQYDTVCERDFVYGTSLLLKKAVIDKTAYMDPYYFMGIEEYDYCTRAKEAGFKIIYVPQSKIWHKVGASISKLPQFPETQRLIKSKGMSRTQYKYYYRLFSQHCPPVVFIFPFIMKMSLLGPFLYHARHGEWHIIKHGIARRLGLFGRLSD
jgi:GT2 family glycosyltransferase